MRAIESNDEIKHIQLDILLAFHQFCMENDLKYSLAAGSLIGAVRHHGFIPWDDDIDVYLMRDDYKRLITLFPDKYQKYFSLVTSERDNNWHRPFGKLYDNRTLEIESTRNKYQEQGMGIDIFPIDEVPDNIDEWLKFEKRRRLLRDISSMKSLLYSNKRSLAKNLLMFVCRLLLSPLSFSYLSKLTDKYAQLHNGKGYKHVYENCPGVYNSKHPWLKDDFEEVIDASFEGHTVKIMRGYDDYLTTVYGDYMKLPPKEKQVSHHDFKAYWKAEEC